MFILLHWLGPPSHFEEAMSLIAAGVGPAQSEEDAIANNGFWPEIDVASFRAIEKLDSTVTTHRVTHALIAARLDLNRQLADWQAEQVATGAITVDDVARPAWATEDHYPALYKRALFALAHASLLERYRDFSATSASDTRGQEKDQAAEDYRRDARWAVAELLGRTHATVELI